MAARLRQDIVEFKSTGEIELSHTHLEELTKSNRLSLELSVQSPKCGKAH